MPLCHFIRANPFGSSVSLSGHIRTPSCVMGEEQETDNWPNERAARDWPQMLGIRPSTKPPVRRPAPEVST